MLGFLEAIGESVVTEAATAVFHFIVATAGAIVAVHAHHHLVVRPEHERLHQHLHDKEEGS